MSIGNPTSKPTDLKMEQHKEIPLSWFVAVGRKDQGINIVSFSDEFLDLGGPNFRGKIEQYGHFMGNTFTGGRLVNNSSEIKDKKRKDIVESAEKRIKEVTGFSAEELWKKMAELTTLHRGKQEASVKVELY